MNKEKSKVVVAWLALVLSASLLRFRVILQSDTLFLDDLFSDLLQRGGQWVEWKFPPAPAFIPDMLLYLFALPFSDVPATRVFLVSFIQVLLLAAALLWCAKKIYPALSSSATVSILLLLSLFTLASARSGMWLYFYSTNNHIATLLFGLTGLGLAVQYLAQPNRASAAWLVAGCTAALLSSKLFMLSFMLPMFALLGCAWLAMGAARQTWQPQRRLLLQLGAMLLAAQVLTAVLTKVLIRNPAVEGRLNTSADTAASALRNMILSIKSSFSPDNLFTLACAVLLLLALLFLVWRLLRAFAIDQQGLTVRATDWRYGAAAALLGAVLLINVTGVVLSGGFGDPYGLRYLTFPLALTLLLCVISLDKRSNKRAWLLGAAQLALGAVITINGVRLTQEAPSPGTDNSALAAGCLERIAAEGFPLRAGVADYWNGRAVSYLLHNRHPILVTANTLAPSFHVSTLGPVLRPQAYPAHYYNFVVLYAGATPVDPMYTATAMRAVLPPPARVESCADGRMEIWLYQDQSLDQAVKQAGAVYLQARKGGQ